MLRMTALVLLLANALYFAWTQGWLGPLGLAPVVQSEPERLQQQVRPEAVELLNGPPPNLPATAATNDAAMASPNAGALPPEPTVCMRAQGFTPEQAGTLREALEHNATLTGAWDLAEVRAGGRWIVYMGRLNDDQMQRKKAELRELKVDFREVSTAGLAPGLALGTYSAEASAEQGLADVQRKGVRTARVAQERPESAQFVLRLPQSTAEQRAAIAALGSAMAGKLLQSCE
ncbi:hypothetical protein GCM10007935_29740 [Hydrogenophaga electricum]|uniref:SPOR domain-containing protein n=2 Tax=Hydrogenophaga electricum TaxID=1230953 RepID=A0ABQ6C5G1_9BURK|nr:hypothetical protein GCM10007935_29740 [Hydrogenophaga electricum]